jgi:hypothetical protein
MRARRQVGKREKTAATAIQWSLSLDHLVGAAEQRDRQAATAGAVHPSMPAKTRAPQDDGH